MFGTMSLFVVQAIIKGFSEIYKQLVSLELPVPFNKAQKLINYPDISNWYHLLVIDGSKQKMH